MSVNGRSPSKLLVFALALPIFGLVYVTTFGARFWAALRPAVATFLGGTSTVTGATANACTTTSRPDSTPPATTPAPSANLAANS